MLLYLSVFGFVFQNELYLDQNDHKDDVIEKTKKKKGQLVLLTQNDYLYSLRDTGLSTVFKWTREGSLGWLFGLLLRFPQHWLT